MDRSDLVQKITEIHTSSTIEATENTNATEEKFLVFSIKDQQYAFYAQQVKEIAFESELFFVPFVPTYIRGYINRQGEPHTVFDLRLLFGEEQLESTKFLVMNHANDQMAFMITDILEILKIPKQNIRNLTADSSLNRYFTGSFTHQAVDIFIINLECILEKLASDL